MRFLRAATWIAPFFCAFFAFWVGLGIVAFDANFSDGNLGGVYVVVGAPIVLGVLWATWKRAFPDRWP